MKKYIKYLFVAVFCTGMTLSCSFLDEDSRVQIDLNKFIKNEEEAVLFLYGDYAMVKNVVFGNEFLAATDLLTDDIDFPSTDIARRQLGFLTFNSNNKVILSIWGKLYGVIEQSNILLDKIEQNPDLTQKSGQAIVAEARFIRAWAYFHLVQLWGEVPLVTVPVYNIKDGDLHPAKSSVEQIYTQIISDLSFAADNLGEAASKVTFREDVTYPFAIRKAAAKLLLAKTYLLTGQYQEVVEALAMFGTPDGTVNENYGLVDQFGHIFDVRYKKDADRSKEVLWEMEAEAVSGLNNTLHREMAPRELRDSFGAAWTEGNTSGYQNYLPTFDLMHSFDPGDERYRQGYRFAVSAPDSRPAVMKGYDVLTTDQNTSGPNAILLRTADAYLCLAEAINELGDPAAAKPFVDIVRARAELAPLPDGLTKEETTDAIMLERRHEFAIEGAYRLFDLRRTGRYKEVMLKYIEFQNMLLTNPTAEYISYKFIDPVRGTQTNVITVPFVKNNKIWQDRVVIHPIPNEELIANKRLEQDSRW